jgi:hypothetical protein
MKIEDRAWGNNQYGKMSLIPEFASAFICANQRQKVLLSAIRPVYTVRTLGYPPPLFFTLLLKTKHLGHTGPSVALGPPNRHPAIWLSAWNHKP